MSEPDPIDTYTGYQLRFWFLEIQPVIWRRLLLRADNTLADLHYAIQITCNWSDDFLHQFKIHGKNMGVPRIYGISYSEPADAVKLADLQLYKNERFLYEYNFHVNWQIEIRLEETDTLTVDRSYPLCIGGKRAAPPEDCGGPAHSNQLRAYFSPFYIYHQLLDGYEMYQRRDQLSEEEQYEFEVRQQEISRFSYWAKVDKFDRRTANKRLKLYAAGNDNWMSYEEVSW
jgi:hypothetical protein